MPYPPPENQALFDRWIEYLARNRNRAPATQRIYRLALRRLDECLEGAPVSGATAEDLLLFTGPWLHRKGVNAHSRRIYVTVMRGFFDWLHAQKMVAASPAAGLSFPEIGRRLPRVMSLENAEKLLWAPDFSTFAGLRDGCIIAILLGCGLRASGICALNQEDLVARDIAGKPRLALRVTEKGDRERLVPVPTDADLLLRIYLQHPDLAAIDRALPDGQRILFVRLARGSTPEHEFRGAERRMKRKAVLDLVQRHGKRAGIDLAQLHPHALRHLYGTELVEADVDTLTVQKLMGHADAKTTAIYVHLAAHKLTQASDKGSPLAKIKTPVSALLKRLGTRS